MGKIIAAIVVIALLVLGYVYFFDTDADVEGEFDTPEVEMDVEGDFDAPDVDLDVDGPELGEEEVTVTVPTIEPADEGDADAEATDDDPDRR